MKFSRPLSLLAAGLAVTAVLSPAHAVELQQKWQAGQSLGYDLSLNGTANLKVPSDANFPLAGIPLEIEVNGKGLARINTLEVDRLGTGTVFVEVPRFDLNGRALGQKALLELRDGTTRLLINGKAVGTPTPDPKNAPNKTYGLVIGKDGRVKRVQELDKNGKLLAADAVKARTNQVADEADDAVAPADAIDKNAFATSIILQALPTLWPKGDVQPGDTWKTTLPLPAAFARTPEAAKNAAPLSEWTMTLKGEEMVDGASLWRVGIVGGIAVDGKYLPKPATPKKGEKPVPELDNLTQSVDGDIWIDAAKGQIVRGDMVIDARGESHTINDKGRNSDPAWADYTGTFGLRLRDTVNK